MLPLPPYEVVAIFTCRAYNDNVGRYTVSNTVVQVQFELFVFRYRCSAVHFGIGDDMLVVFVKQLSVGRAGAYLYRFRPIAQSDVYGTCIGLSFVILENAYSPGSFGWQSVIGAVVYL